ncbi:pollen-specific leucine-rich repeat extensin-like protein 1 [Sorghum bicolor]|uniref:pollen-specific leucine-rich repeat extensin-like protein 1 n=1 Tax=Sorghum bicolor TaxID=4558 RepID=UPI000B42626A|nr:pollen-specific leucine-rich repeat extensin-like protein 1 [Sorghum bicolor]|eukprot:XP_021311887.1 pollen-specific leucine-rich repeat extensin-like protein 1 [Sorghum bicolor]
MTVCEYHDKFTQLSRYCPNEVENDEDKQDHFLEGLNDGLSYMMSNVKHASFQEMVDRALVLESKHRKMEDKKRKYNSSQQQRPASQAPRQNAPAPSGSRQNSNTVPVKPNANPTHTGNTCFKCGQLGHYVNACPQRQKNNNNNGMVNHVKLKTAEEAPDVFKKCLRVPEEQLPLEELDLQDDLTYEESPIKVLDTADQDVFAEPHRLGPLPGLLETRHADAASSHPPPMAPPPPGLRSPPVWRAVHRGTRLSPPPPARPVHVDPAQAAASPAPAGAVHHGPRPPAPRPGPQHSAVDRPLPRRHVARPATAPRAPAAFAEKPSGLFKINPQSCSV